MGSIKRIIFKRLTSFIFTISIFFLISMNLFFACAGEVPKYEPLPVKKQRPHVWHLITIDSINLSAADFYEAWTGRMDNDPRYITYSTRLGEPGDPKDKANLYLLGVLDATEGKSWCGYGDSFDIKAVREKVAEHFKTNPKKTLAARRASDVIETALKKNFPACKKERSSTLPAKRGEVTPDIVNLSGEDFYNAAYAPIENGKTQKVLSEMYMLGVFDSTEGRLWCNYWTIHSISLREDIYAHFHKLAKCKMKERASTIMLEALRYYVPSCKGNK
jgi:hypothetical protein